MPNETNEAVNQSLAEGMLSPGAMVVPLAKAHFVGENSANESKALTERSKTDTALLSKGALEPVYAPSLLALIYENSSSLRQNVDAYVTNIDSFGHSFVPVFDIDDKESDEKIRDAIRAERYELKRSGEAAKSLDLLKAVAAEPTDEEVKKRKEDVRIEMRAERAMLESFFENCTPTMPFSGPEGLRGLTRQDIEVFGYGYWEVLRNGLGEISQFNRLEGRSVRLMPEDDKPTSATQWTRVSALKLDKKTVKKRFRRYIQSYEPGTQVVYFKEFGDPRAMDAKTGTYYANSEAMKAALAKEHGDKAEVCEATEIYPFKITSVRSAYGVPRWIGALLAVLGNRQAEEVNFLYFENRSVPPMAILVSGGHLNADTVSRLQDYITNEIRGKRNFHKVMILEAEAGNNTDPALAGKMKITLQPLTGAQQSDALFQGYDERNDDKVGKAFRLPRILRGDIRDFNRSTAEAALDFAELQVFGPLRQDFDWRMNKLILPELGVRYHSFRSNAPTVRDPAALSDMLSKMSTAGILTPGEARELSELVFNRPLRKIDAPWTQQPMALSLISHAVEDDLSTSGDESRRYRSDAMSVPGAADTQRALGAGASTPTTDKKRSKKAETIAKGLLKIHQHLLEEERSEFAEMQKDAEIVKVPEDIFLSWFKNGTATESSRGGT